MVNIGGDYRSLILFTALVLYVCWGLYIDYMTCRYFAYSNSIFFSFSSPLFAISNLRKRCSFPNCWLVFYFKFMASSFSEQKEIFVHSFDAEKFQIFTTIFILFAGTCCKNGNNTGIGLCYC